MKGAFYFTLAAEEQPGSRCRCAKMMNTRVIQCYSCKQKITAGMIIQPFNPPEEANLATECKQT